MYEYAFCLFTIIKSLEPYSTSINKGPRATILFEKLETHFLNNILVI